jgi:hypothetical protein
MREHFVRAIADEDMFGLDPMMDGERLAQLLRLGIGLQPESVSSRVSHRFQCERRRAERAFVSAEFYQIGDARLLTGHIGRKLTRDLAPERAHIKSIGKL